MKKDSQTIHREHAEQKAKKDKERAKAGHKPHKGISMGSSHKQDNALPEQQYKEASPPEPGDLIGKWKITVLSGRLPNMRRIGHVKVIKIKDGQLSGYNRILRFIKLGKFTVVFRKSEAMFCYDAPFYDLVRKVNDDLMIGQYILERDSGMGDVTGYFEMRCMRW